MPLSDLARRNLNEFVHDAVHGRFTRPEEGWSAPFIVAHFALGNEAFADVAATIAASGDSAYDNEPSVSDDVLGAFVAQHGDIDGLVAAVVLTGNRLLRALDALTLEQLVTQIPVRIVDHGGEVSERRDSVGELIDWHFGAHLAAHRAQLRALRLAQLQCVILREPESARHLDAATAARLREAHRAFLALMAEEGKILVSGPLDEQDDPALRGLMFYDVGSIERAREIAAQDPGVKGGLFEVTASTFSVRTGALVAGSWRE